MSESPRVLLVKLSAIGDCLHATPVAQAIRDSMPSAHLGWAVHSHCAPVVVGNPFVNRVHQWNRKDFWSALLRVSREIRSERYDLSLDLQGLAKSGLLARLSGVKFRYGPSEAREMAGVFYNRRLPNQDGNHIITSYLNRAVAIGAKCDQAPPMHFPIQEKDRTYARLLLSETGVKGRPIVILNPSAGKANKQWPPECFARLAEALESQGVFCVLTGAPSDRALADQVMNHVKNRALIHDLVGRTNLTQLAALLGEASLFVGGDTGPMHIAQAVDTRVVALFGPTDPKILGPLDLRDRVISKFGQSSDRAMHLITVDEVFDLVKEILPTNSGVS